MKDSKIQSGRAIVLNHNLADAKDSLHKLEDEVSKQVMDKSIMICKHVIKDLDIRVPGMKLDKPGQLTGELQVEFEQSPYEVRQNTIKALHAYISKYERLI